MKFSSSIISNINGVKAAAQTGPIALRGGGSGDEGATAEITASDSTSTSINRAGSNTGSPSAKIASSTESKTVSDPNDATDTAAADVANDSANVWSKSGLRVHASTAVAFLVLGDDGRPMSLQTNDNAVNVETTLKLQNSMAGNPNGFKKNCAETFDSTVIDLFFSNNGSVPTENRSGDTNKVSNVT